MPGDTLQIGPFVGGINTKDDPSSIADEELVDCVNFDPQLNGSLQVRSPIQTISNTGVAGTIRILLIGVASFASGEYTIGTNDGGVYQRTTGDWTLITNTFQAAAMVQYADKIWLVPKIGSGTPGGTWDGTTFTADSDIPQGQAAGIYKERMFVVPGFDATTNSSRLKFSNAGVFGTWGASDFIDISPGDGQKLVDLQVFKGNLLLFKDKGTRVLSYDSTPFDAVIDPISTTIGPSNPYCTCQYENSIFVYQEGRVYEMVNFDYQQVNVKVPFVTDQSTPSSRSENAFLSNIGDRLVVRHFNRLYVLGLRTRVWTRWESTDLDLHNFGKIVKMTLPANDEYIAGSSVTSNQKVYRIKEDLDSTTDERNASTPVDIVCAITTKNYNLAASHVFKRLNWWGVDVLTNRLVTGRVTPIVNVAKVTWGFIKGLSLTWDQIDGKQWGFPTGGVIYVEDPGVDVGAAVTRKFLKFVKALRYRQVNFSVSFPASGTMLEGPARLYWLTMTTSTRQVVSKKVS
jgi:hypothetical protein